MPGSESRRASSSLPQALQRGIQLAPLRIASLVGHHIVSIRLDALGNFDGLPTGFVKVGPVPRPDSGHQRRAKCAAFFGGEHFDGVAVDPSLNLPPQLAARAAPAQADACHRNAQLGKERKRVFKGVGDPLQYRTHKMR